MIVRNRDIKQLKISIEKTEKAIASMRNQIDDLESDISWSEEDLYNDKQELAKLEGKYTSTPAKKNARPKSEVPLTVYYDRGQ